MALRTSGKFVISACSFMALTFLPRVGTGQFAHGKLNPREAGHKGGVTPASENPRGSARAEGNTHKPLEHGKVKLNGEPDGR